MLDTFDVITRILAAVVAGAILGWERETHKKPAGLRTQMLVSLGAAVFVLAGLQFRSQATAENPQSGADFLKVIAGIIGGIGFLGAGSIIQSGGSVKGLTTAATIWISAAIGVSCGLGYYVLTAACVLLALGILIILGVLERFVPQAPTASEAEKKSATQ